MAIIWCGGEDIDFPNGNAVSVDLTAARSRSGYARCAVGPGVGSGNTIKSTTFSAVTSAWISVRCFISSLGAANFRMIGLAKSGSNSGLFIGNQSASNGRLTLYKWDGGVLTQLAAETGNSLPTGSILRLDMLVANYGVAATVNVYLNGTQVLSYSGDVSLGGISNLDQVWIAGSGSLGALWSEIMLADQDTRSLQGLVTLALTGTGDTNAWTAPTYTNINGTTFSDVNPTYSNTSGQDNEYNVTDLPSGTFVPRAVKISARAAVSSGATATQIKMGYKSGGSVAFGTGATKSPSTAYTTLEQLDATNPVSGSGWAQSDINALQLDFQSA